MLDSLEPLPLMMAPDDPNRLINRDLSWLAFNRRVIEEATNTRHPLLERVNFLAIAASNLDEFLVVHIATIEQQYSQQPTHLSAVNDAIADLLIQHRTIWAALRKELATAGIVIGDIKDLAEYEAKWLAAFFHDNIFPALTPLAIDTVHPFPFIPNGGVALAVGLHDKIQHQDLNVILPLPPQLARFIRLPMRDNDPTIRFIMLEDVIQYHLTTIFPSLQIREATEFRVLRDSEIQMGSSLDADDFVNTFESAIKRRYHGAIVRLTLTRGMSSGMRAFLVDQLEVTSEKVVVRDGFMRFSDIKQIIVRDRPDLVFTPYVPRFPERVREFAGDCFAAISHKDILVHHPYESFDVVLQFVRQAAQDPAVVAIKQTLYRTSSASPIVKALIAAAEAGKSVTVMVELKARFDEEANIRWARDLEKAGAHVVFGFMNMKTHAKITLVIRRENDALRSYAHFGTGNYHPETARIYTDLSFFTSDPVLCQDAGAVFNYMTGYTRPAGLKKLPIAPLYLRATLIALIETEIEHAKAGRPAQIWAKLNALVDPAIIDKLYDASRAGVSVELIVRGACCLRPGVPGLSENIRVKSIVGRFLEHSRMVALGNGNRLPHAKAKLFISSADWMMRNFDRRIETLVPIENPTVHQQILNQIFPACLMDTMHSWDLQADGSYVRALEAGGFSAHDYFMTNPSLSGRGANLDKKVLPPQLNYKPRRKSNGRTSKEIKDKEIKDPAKQ